MNSQPPTIDDIRAAHERIAGQVMETPFLPSQTLSQIAGCELSLKFENLQFTASFKERGALNKLLTLWPRERASGVCAMSAGNHAQGVAFHAARLGIAATIVMPVGTPMTKVARTREHGAKVIVEGRSFSESCAVAEREAKMFGLTLVHPFDDPEIIAGQGTMALEMLAKVSNLDAIVVPVGGGGLISGIALAVKALAPHVRIVGVQSQTYPSMARAIQDLPPIDAEGLTIAEGIAVKNAGMLTRQIVRALVDDILLVKEASIEGAVALLQSVEKTVVEGAGAAGLAAILEHPDQFAGKRVATILSGGNIDPRMFASVILRDLVRSGRVIRIEVPITDRPGALAELATVLAGQGANIVDVAHDRLSLALNAKGATLALMIEVESIGHGEETATALCEAGFEPVVRPLR